MTNQYDKLIQIYADKYRIEFRLLKAIIAIESDFNQWSIRYEPNYRWTYSVKELAEIVKCTRPTMQMMQMISYGLMQIMGAVAYELGLRVYATKLLDPDINIQYGCELLLKIMKKEEIDNPSEIYGIYNAGSLRYLPDGKLENQANVDRFIKIYNSI